MLNMNYKIRCEQFVYGKLVGVRGAGYELIARSPGITPKEAFAIYKEFNDYRPTATSSIAVLKPTYIVQRLENRMVFLRLARSNEKEPGRGYFLQERYIVLDLADVLNSKVKPWLWRLGIPATVPSFTTRDDSLPDYLLLDRQRVHEHINQAISLLTRNGGFQCNVIVSLNHVLRSRPISVPLHEDEAYRWSFLTAISLLTPNWKIPDITLYMGKILPQNCKVDISVVDKKTGATSTNAFLDSSNLSIALQSLEQIRKSYTNLTWRCLKANDLQLLNELIATVENADVQALPATPTTPLDVLLWTLTMPTVGLQLARREYTKDDTSIEDWHWLWRKSINSFTTIDIRQIFSALVRYTIDDWGEADFVSWRRLIEQKPEAISEIKIDNEILPRFLELWLSFTTTFTGSETNWFISLMEDLVKFTPKYSVSLLVRWIHKANIENLFSGTLKVLQAISDYSMLDEYYWDLFLSLGNRVESQDQLFSFSTILKAITAHEEIKPLSEFVNSLCNDENSSPKIELTSSLNVMFHSVNEATYHIGEIIDVLLILSLLSRKKDAIIILANIVRENEQRPYNQSSRLTKMLDSVLNGWILPSRDHRLLEAFIFLLGKLERYPANSQRILLSILRKNENLFFAVVGFMQEQLQVQREDVQIFLSDLSDLPKAEQLHLFVVYIVSTQSLPYTKQDIQTLENLLGSVVSLEGIINKRYQNDLLNIFSNASNSHICQRILEHQIRSALLTGNVKLSLEKCKQLQHVYSMPLGLTNLTNRFWANSAKRYFSALSDQQKKDFLDWLLKAPLDAPPNMERKISFFLTSAILEQWLSSDPVIRLTLFREAIHIVNSQLSANRTSEI